MMASERNKIMIKPNENTNDEQNEKDCKDEMAENSIRQNELLIQAMKGLTDADFTKKIADGIRNAAKKAQVTLTNEAVGKLLTTMNVALSTMNR